MQNSRSITRLLGFAGVLPFVFPALLVVLGAPYAGLAREFAEVYAFGIVNFICGSWWGLALRDHSHKAFWLSNLIFLLSFFIFLLARPWWPLAAAVLLMGLYFIEHNSGMFTPFPQHYRSLRIQLSSIAAASMLVLQLFTSDQ